SQTRMDIELTEPLIVSALGLKWLALKSEYDITALTKAFAYWSRSAGPTRPSWAPNAVEVDPGGVYGDAMPETFPDNPTISERGIGMGVLVQSESEP
ncbi:unnamed protein product, partial [marine sediment metagenome]